MMDPLHILSDYGMTNNDHIVLLRRKLVEQRGYKWLPNAAGADLYAAADGVPVVLYTPQSMAAFSPTKWWSFLGDFLSSWAVAHGEKALLPGFEDNVFPARMRIVIPINDTRIVRYSLTQPSEGLGSHWTGLMLELQLDEKQALPVYKEVTAVYMDSGISCAPPPAVPSATAPPPPRPSAIAPPAIPSVIMSFLRLTFPHAKITPKREPVPYQGLGTNYCGDATTLNTLDYAFEGKINKRQNLAAQRRQLQAWIREYNASLSGQTLPTPVAATVAKVAAATMPISSLVTPIVPEVKVAATMPAKSIPVSAAPVVTNDTAAGLAPVLDSGSLATPLLGAHRKQLSAMEESERQPKPISRTPTDVVSLLAKHSIFRHSVVPPAPFGKADQHYFLNDAQTKLVQTQIDVLTAEIIKLKEDSSTRKLKEEKKKALQKLLRLDCEGAQADIRFIPDTGLVGAIAHVKAEYTRVCKGFERFSCKHHLFFVCRTEILFAELQSIENNKSHSLQKTA